MAGKKGQKKRVWSDDEKLSICAQARVAGWLTMKRGSSIDNARARTTSSRLNQGSLRRQCLSYHINCELALNAQELEMRRELPDFIRGPEILADNGRADRQHGTGFVAFRPLAVGFLSHRLAQPFGRLKVVHLENLLHPALATNGETRAP